MIDQIEGLNYDQTKQVIVYGCAYLLGSSIKIDLRRKIEEEMIKLYLNRLEENGTTSFDFDMAWDDYLKSLLGYAYLPPLGFT